MRVLQQKDSLLFAIDSLSTGIYNLFNAHGDLFRETITTLPDPNVNGLVYWNHSSPNAKRDDADLGAT